MLYSDGRNIGIEIRAASPEDRSGGGGRWPRRSERRGRSRAASAPRAGAQRRHSRAAAPRTRARGAPVRAAAGTHRAHTHTHTPPHRTRTPRTPAPLRVLPAAGTASRRAGGCSALLCSALLSPQVPPGRGGFFLPPPARKSAAIEGRFHISFIYLPF